MKALFIFILIAAMFSAACTQHSCPTYGSSYSYSPPRQGLFKSRSGYSGKKSSSKKAAKKAEAD